VCLSILGTWEGPSWSPSQTLSTVLLSIQSLMSSAPYHQEPGFETERCPGDSQNYNQVVEHETLRVAVCDMMEGKVRMQPATTLENALLKRRKKRGQRSKGDWLGVACDHVHGE
jgi:ubiquitin-conjugating enzyme E2 Z